ncbi:site-specific integrase [Planococcus sp. CAU13]|uniref:site-specific integrase n=1 Tax=Planococcus sp. CAU13 TaxID=1541197 RepID=UPI00052FEC42|nr:site-specific integrase [Planococcus sp. CAU13]
MLENYREYRLKAGISPVTLVTEVELLKSFVGYVNQRNDKQLEPHEIRPADVRAFLDQEKAKGLKASTIKRKLYHIRQYFHYLWKVGKVPVDFMPKFEYELVIEKPVAQLLYAEFQDSKKQVLQHPSLALNAKLYFLFAMAGFRMREIERLQSRHFRDLGDRVEMNFVTTQEVYWRLVFEDPMEVAVIVQAMERALFRDHDYLVSSDKKYGADYVRNNMKDIYSGLSALLPKAFKTEEVRLAYIYDLYKVQGKSFDEMGDLLGVTPESLTSTLKLVFERYKK